MIRLLTTLALAATLGGCAFLQETVEDINTPENREKAAKGLVKAADVSCTAAVQYLATVGPQIENADEYITEIRSICADTEALPAAPVEALLPEPKPEVTT